MTFEEFSIDDREVVYIGDEMVGTTHLLAPANDKERARVRNGTSKSPAICTTTPAAGNWNLAPLHVTDITCRSCRNKATNEANA